MEELKMVIVSYDSCTEIPKKCKGYDCNIYCFHLRGKGFKNANLNMFTLQKKNKIKIIHLHVY